MGLQRVSGDHHTGQVQVGPQWPEPGNLARRAVDLSLGKDGAGGVVHRGEQVDLPALGVAGAAQRLAVDRDRPWPSVGTVAVGQPGADRGARASASSRARLRRIVVSLGTAHTQWPVRGSRRVPSAARTGWGASAAHSAMAAIDRAPAKTAAAASTRMATSRCRRPARVLGSVTVAR